MHALATLMKLKHKWKDLVYINIEHSICGSKCNYTFKYLSLDILNHNCKKILLSSLRLLRLQGLRLTFLYICTPEGQCTGLSKYCQLRQSLKRCICLNMLIEVGDGFCVGNVDSVSFCPMLKCLNNSGCLLFFSRLTFQVV